ncbi:MAG TPA: diacylglycerol kinase family protein [Gaiellaceae bacterium]|nr:diacylglycerol kinase family protein [Gaiellaceae bacterium]
MNPSSGDGGADELLEAARARGIATHVLADGDDPAAVARGADDGALGMAGGDGSLAIVAGVAIERGLPFVCVPFGTRNHFARDLGLDRDDPTGALDAFGNGVERRVDVGRAGDRLFLNNVSLGVYAHLVHRRERHRRRRNALARLRALEAVVRNRHGVGLTIDGEPVHARVVLVANNAYELSVLSLGERERLDGGLLHVYAAHGLLRADWEERSCEQVTIDTPARRVRAAVDGEPEVLRTPVEFRVEPRALRVLVPREQNPQDATKEDTVDNPEPTETEEELAQTERQEEEEDMRGTTDPDEQG